MSQQITVKRIYPKGSSSSRKFLEEETFSFFYNPAPNIFFNANVVVKAKKMYLNVNYDWVSRFSKGGFVILLEFAQHRWHCTDVIVSFLRDCEYRDDMIRVFLAMGFSVLPLGDEMALDLKQDDVSLVYKI